MVVIYYLSFVIPSLSRSAVAFCAIIMRSPGLWSFGLGIAEVTSTNLAGLLLIFPCQVQRNSLVIKNSADAGAASGLSLAMLVSARAMVNFCS